MCVLHRTFAIKQMVRWGVEVALIRDLTDAMYNPAMAPYVSHDEGTRLVVEFIEKFLVCERAEWRYARRIKRADLFTAMAVGPMRPAFLLV